MNTITALTAVREWMVRVMSDYIKRESRTFIEIADDLNDLVTELNDKIVESIREKNADVAPVRHGRWEVIDAEEPRRYGCSKCKRLSWHMENYCPNCGARMDAKE